LTVIKFQFLSILYLFLVFSLQGQLTSRKYIVDRIEFEGNESFSSPQLQKLIKLKEPLFIKYEFNRRALMLDAMTLKNFYKSKGFLEVSVKDSFNITEYNTVDVFFLIEEGNRSYLQSVVIDGNLSFSDNRIMRLLGLKIGEPFNFIGLRQRMMELEHEYGRLGKLFVTIEHSPPLEEEINLTISIQEGPTVKIDQILIDGLSQVDSSFVLRELRIKEGTVYNEDLIELSQRQIFETGLFSFVDISPLKHAESENLVNIKVEVREFTSSELILEPGISRLQTSKVGGEPISGAEIAGQILKRRILNTGQHFRLRGSVEFPLEMGKSSFIKNVKSTLYGANFRSEFGLSGVWIDRLRIPNNLRLFWVRFEDDDVMRFGGEWNALHRFSDKSVIQGGLRFAKIDVARKKQEDEPSLHIRYRYRNLNNPIIPTDGRTVSFESSLVGVRNYYRVEFDFRQYSQLRSSAVLAFRAKLGHMGGLTTDYNIPSFDNDETKILFYLGGSTNLRGWESQRFQRYDVIDTKGNTITYPKGGRSKVLINTEVRIPLWWILGLDFFLDGGILSDGSVSDLKHHINRWTKGKGWNYGIELTIATPLGPIRLYYAIPLKEEPLKSPQLGVPYAF